MNTIPICKNSILITYYKQKFPIIVLDDWSDLDLNYLENEYSKFEINHKYLDLNYILNNII